MTEPETHQEPKEKTVYLHPRHMETVRTYATESGRSFSNALQFIIDDWVRMKGAAIKAAAPANQERAR